MYTFLHIFQSSPACLFNSLPGRFWPTGLMFDTTGLSERNIALIKFWLTAYLISPVVKAGTNTMMSSAGIYQPIAEDPFYSTMFGKTVGCDALCAAFRKYTMCD